MSNVEIQPESQPAGTPAPVAAHGDALGSSRLNATNIQPISKILQEKKLVLVTGKGGVGKSVISSFLALHAKHLGLRPLLFECDAPPRPSLFPMGRDTDDVVQEVVPGIFAVNQNSDEAVKEYANAALPSRMLSDLLIENRISRLFLRASPSVNEMALVGRMMQMAHKYAQEGPIIVDLHATGHALHMLRAPDGIMRVLRGGPVYDRAKIVQDFLFDPSNTSILTVAHPEELPVTESLEFIAALAEMRAPLGPVLMNGFFEDSFPLLTDDVLATIQEHVPNGQEKTHDLWALRQWANRCEREHGRLKNELNAFGLPLFTLPYLVSTPKRETIASALHAKIMESPEGVVS